MSNLIEAAPEEPGGGSGGSNRAFVMIALGLASLLVVGLLLVFGFVVGSRLGFIGTRALASPDASAFLSGPAGTATSAALDVAGAGSTGVRLPLSATSAAGSVTAAALAGAAQGSVSTLLPAAATSTAASVPNSTRVTGATPASSAPAAGSTAAVTAATTIPSSTTLNTATPTPTRVVSSSALTPAAAATNASSSSALSTPAAGTTISPSNTPGGANSGSRTDATATPSGAGSGLPGTGVELDVLILGLLMALLLVIARGFRMAMRL